MVYEERKRWTGENGLNRVFYGTLPVQVSMPFNARNIEEKKIYKPHHTLIHWRKTQVMERKTKIWSTEKNGVKQQTMAKKMFVCWRNERHTGTD